MEVGLKSNKFVLSVVLLLVVTGFSLALTMAFRAAGGSGAIAPHPTSVWSKLLEATPFAYFTPLPEPAQTAIDGTYAKVDSSWPQWWKCLRCADYRAAGGIWRLQFDKGVMRIFYEVNGWRSIASYTVSEDRLFVFNDPYCPEHVGEYRWSVADGQLTLETVKDVCSFHLRAENLSKQAWLACDVSNPANAAEAPGCAEKRSGQLSIIPEDIAVEVTVYGGDSRFFSKPPDVIAHANSADRLPPNDIQISFAEESIPYGLQRVIWWNGAWIEAVSDGAFEAMGVQFLGEQTIGWARVLFDGEEVWRGDTAAIWSKSGRHGGFVEISGFTPGKHILRVEALGFDYRPVTVASFGFVNEKGVIP